MHTTNLLQKKVGEKFVIVELSLQHLQQCDSKRSKEIKLKNRLSSEFET